MGGQAVVREGTAHLDPVATALVGMHAGLLFKQNCYRRWITAATLVAGVETLRAVSLANHFRRSF